MISAKQLSIFKHFNPEGQAYVFYIDNRAGGKGYEEFLRRVIEEDQAHYIRGRVAKVFQEGGRLVLRAEDSLAGGVVEVEADMVVLATGLVPQNDYLNVARALNLATDKNGFFLELHPKLGPVETSLVRHLSGRRGPGPQGHPGISGPGGRRRRRGSHPLCPGPGPGGAHHCPGGRPVPAPAARPAWACAPTGPFPSAKNKKWRLSTKHSARAAAPARRPAQPRPSRCSSSLLSKFLRRLKACWDESIRTTYHRLSL